VIEDEFTIHLNLVCALEDTIRLRELLGNVAVRGVPFKTVGLRRKTALTKTVMPAYPQYHDIEIDQTYFTMVNDYRMISTKPITFPENKGLRVTAFDFVVLSIEKETLQIRCTVGPQPILIHPETVIHIPTGCITIDIFQ